MKIVFLGTPEFAVASLEALIRAGHTIAAVVTAPDRPAGRGLDIKQSPVKAAALRHHLPVLQPTNLKDPVFLSELSALGADLFVVVAFRMLPEAVWKMPGSGTFNLHASLLPQYRGAAPINHAIMNGEKITGVSTFFLQQEIDTGNILFREEVAIADDDDAGSLHDKLMQVGSELVVKTVAAIANGNTKGIPQENFAEGMLKPAPKIYKENCRISWDRKAENIRDQIRGLSPYPGAWTRFHFPGKAPVEVKLFSAAVREGKEKPGTIIVSGDELMIACGEGMLNVRSVQAAGKKRMGISEYLRGMRVPPGSFAQ